MANVILDGHDYVGDFEFFLNGAQHIGKFFLEMNIDIAFFKVFLYMRNETLQDDWRITPNFIAGEMHLLSLPLLTLDWRNYILISKESPKDMVFICCLKYFRLEAKCPIIYREGQQCTYAVCQQIHQGPVIAPIESEYFAPFDFSNRNPQNFAFSIYIAMETIAKAFVDNLRPCKGSAINFVVTLVSFDAWSHILKSVYDPVLTYKKTGTRQVHLPLMLLIFNFHLFNYRSMS